MAIPYAEFLGNDDPFPVMESTPSRIAELTANLSAEQIAAAPAPGKWSVHQIVAHLADTELMFQVRVRLIVFEDMPVLQAYDQDRWVNGWEREKEPWEQTFERFRVLRQSTVRLLRNTPDADLRRTGTHTERGVQAAGDYLITIAGHDRNHLRQIEAALRSASY